MIKARSQNPARERLVSYWLLSYALVLANLAPTLELQLPALALAFEMTVFLTYGVIYLLPPILITATTQRLAGTSSVRAVAVASVGLVQVFLFADRTVYQMFGFHFNGFVWNLITTPGGIESMGAGPSTIVTYALIVVALFLLQAGAMVISTRLGNPTTGKVKRKRLRAKIVILLVLMTVSERIGYGFAHATGESRILEVADRFALYQTTTFRHLAQRLGIQTRSHDRLVADQDVSALRYPLAPITHRASGELYNIVWLVAESWRADTLTPEIMPNTWAFAREGVRFTHHLSGGNGTRVGLFTMFYGLYGSYWHSFLNRRRAPVLMDEILGNGYALCLQTSARFSYPEFDRTIFANVPTTELHEENTGQSWARDRKNVSRAAQWIGSRSGPGQFFYFQFFESPHARYDFPEDTVIRQPYAPGLNYALMDVAGDIELIRNRYINSVHHLDQQFGRVFDLLRQQDLLKRTIVVITGDHGEEFLEHGHWGHNSEFVEEQIAVPLVISGPGIPPAVVDRMTSHLDIAPTILRRLGVTNPERDYSLGFDLFGPERRDHTVVGDWNRSAYIDTDYKIVFPTNARTFVREPVTTRADLVPEDADAVYARYVPRLAGTLAQMGRFRQVTD